MTPPAATGARARRAARRRRCRARRRCRRSARAGAGCWRARCRCRRGASPAPGHGGEPGAVVVDGDDERAAVAARVDAHAAAGDLRLEAVDDRVLDQRLQRQRRQGQAAQRRRHVDGVLEPVSILILMIRM